MTKHKPNYSADVLALNPELNEQDATLSKRSKYRTRRVTDDDGERFDSIAEKNVYHMRLLQQRSGDIRNLKRQPRFDLIVNGVKVCTYIADYEYDLVTTGAHIVEDCKGFKTAVYRLKRKLMKACYGITILETDRDGVPFS